VLLALDVLAVYGWELVVEDAYKANSMELKQAPEPSFEGVSMFRSHELVGGVQNLDVEDVGLARYELGCE